MENGHTDTGQILPAITTPIPAFASGVPADSREQKGVKPGCAV